MRRLLESKVCNRDRLQGRELDRATVLSGKQGNVYLQCSSKGSCPAQAPSLGKEIWQCISLSLPEDNKT